MISSVRCEDHTLRNRNIHNHEINQRRKKLVLVVVATVVIGGIVAAYAAKRVSDDAQSSTRALARYDGVFVYKHLFNSDPDVVELPDIPVTGEILTLLSRSTGVRIVMLSNCRDDVSIDYAATGRRFPFNGTCRNFVLICSDAWSEMLHLGGTQ